MSRPTLQICTTYFSAQDREAAQAIGLALYDRITRPKDDPLRAGGQIPVWIAVHPNRIPFDDAQETMVVPVLGTSSHNSEASRNAALGKIAEWNRQLRKHRVVPVPVSKSWRNEDKNLPVTAKKFLYAEDRSKMPQTLIELVLAALRCLEAEEHGKVGLFISHAKSDLAVTSNVATRIKAFFDGHTTAKNFFDATSLEPGTDLIEEIEKHAQRGAFVMVRGDNYSSREWCQREILRAKQVGIPTLTVEVLTKGEVRTLPYAGNGPALLWRDDKLDEVALAAVIEWLKAVHFAKEGKRLIHSFALDPSTLVWPRAPELLDLAQGPIPSRRGTVVLYPDPELSVHEREVLKKAQPEMKLLTPTTAYREWLKDDFVAPLYGKRIALSLSQSPDAGGEEGFSAYHVDDATVFLTRCLISAGAEIGYGGKFTGDWAGETIYTTLLGELVSRYNQTEIDSAKYLHNYRSASFGKVNDVEVEGLPLTIHLIGDPEDAEGREAFLPSPSPPLDQLSPARKVLHHSDMRMVMTKYTHARVLLAGNAAPTGYGKTGGYVGRLSGVLEEAWRTLIANQPLYVCGGYGGGARLVAELAASPLDAPLPELACEATFAHLKSYVEVAEELENDENDALVQKLGLPRTLDELGKEIRSLLHERLNSDERSVAFNGLTLAENDKLARTRDPVAIASLVLKGLVKVHQTERAGRLKIELIHGSITEARDVGAIAIGRFDNVTMAGPGAALVRSLGRRVADALQRGEEVVSLDSGSVGTRYLIAADLGTLGRPEDVPDQVRRAAKAIASHALGQRLRQIGVVTLGGSVHEKLDEVAQAMLDGFASAGSGLVIRWYEARKERFDALRGILRRPNVALSTLVIPPKSVDAFVPDQVALALVKRAGTSIELTIVPPGGTGTVRTGAVALSDDRIAELKKGNGGGAPKFHDLDVRGRELADALFTKDDQNILERCGKVPLALITDIEASGLPYEVLRLASGHRPALDGGLLRKLASMGAVADEVFARPAPTKKLTVLLIENPLKDLPGAKREADALRSVLRDEIDLRELVEDRATLAAISDMLKDDSIDVVHYCGHAFFDGPGDDRSGLLAADGELTVSQIRELRPRPRLAFMNACQSARVRGRTPAAGRNATAFAEVFLRAGVEAFIGTFWEVSDAGAETFAREVYARLIRGEMLSNAVSAGRRALREQQNSDWANYLLYGEGRFRLVVPEPSI